MNKKGLAYILFVLFILIAILLYVLRDEYFQNQGTDTQSNVQVENEVSMGTEILKEYRTNSAAIIAGTYKIEVYSKKGNIIAYNTYEELQDIIYAGQRYEGMKIIDKDGAIVIRYTLQSYANLISALESASTYNEEKLKLYFENEKVVIDNSKAQEDDEPEQSASSNTNTSANTNTTPTRELGQNEVYGTNVIVDFISHQADIVALRKYFRVVINGTTTAYTSVDELRANINTADIYVKQFELDAAGNLRGYTFTRVQ